MTARETGFLLLTSHLGNPHRRPLSVAQLRTLAARVRSMDRPEQERQVNVQDLISLGYSREWAFHILCLLDEGELLESYLRRARRAGCVPVTRVSPHYPLILRRRLADDAPGCLWARGDVTLLRSNAIALVGSRDLEPENRLFAREAGFQAARQGYTLVSGNARGADKAAQDACIKAGGSVISVVADRLDGHQSRDGVLFLSEDGFDMEFSAQRALSRNRIIHCLGQAVLVAQSGFNRGGTWNGTQKNLRQGWSKVICFADGTEAANRLVEMGACSCVNGDLADLRSLIQTEQSLFDTNS